MSMSSDSVDSSASAPKRSGLARLTLEEKLWFDRRKSDLEQYSAFGAGIGAVVAAGVTGMQCCMVMCACAYAVAQSTDERSVHPVCVFLAFGPFNRRVQLASIIGCAVIGGGSGYLYADTKALARIEDLSAQSRLRKEYQQLCVSVSLVAVVMRIVESDCPYASAACVRRLMEKKASKKTPEQQES